MPSRTPEEDAAGKRLADFWHRAEQVAKAGIHKQPKTESRVKAEGRFLKRHCRFVRWMAGPHKTGYPRFACKWWKATSLNDLVVINLVVGRFQFCYWIEDWYADSKGKKNADNSCNRPQGQ